jgi:hypothetical protein
VSQQVWHIKETSLLYVLSIGLNLHPVTGNGDSRQKAEKMLM